MSDCAVESKCGRGERGDRTLPETHHLSCTYPTVSRESGII